MVEKHDIWTIGHSVLPLEEFLSRLKAYHIRLLADVRGLPGSSKFPQFNKENLELSLPACGIDYVHLPGLGGRRRTSAKSTNTAWRNASFRGFADYMETEGFRKGLTELESIAISQPTAIMCAEAVWWRCHRSMIADALKLRGWEVWHIMTEKKADLHPYTSPAKIREGRLYYDGEAGSVNS